MEDVENRVFNATTPMLPTYWPELRGETYSISQSTGRMNIYPMGRG